MPVFYQGGVVDGAAVFSPVAGALPARLVPAGRISPDKLRAALARARARGVADESPCVRAAVAAIAAAPPVRALAPVVVEAGATYTPPSGWTLSSAMGINTLADRLAQLVQEG